MVRIIRWAYLFSKDTLSASERKEVKYTVSLLDFLEDDLSTVSSSPPSPSPTSASSNMSTDADKFLADLVGEFILLPTSTSSAMLDGEFLADWIGCSEHQDEGFG